MTPETARFLRFGLVGATNTVLSLAAFTLLSKAGMGASAASALAFAVGAANGYVLNRSWTFRARGGPATFARYVAVQAVGAACSATGIALAADALTRRQLLAECVVIPVVTVITYTLSRRLVFRGVAR
jgi:putative flippase GtrA